ncbi:MAG: hypothetical protein L0221_00340 [Chloroflexi bacterium]|nr:hypothetical protein [Chloroflexota bacterium]
MRRHAEPARDLAAVETSALQKLRILGSDPHLLPLHAFLEDRDTVRVPEARVEVFELRPQAPHDAVRFLLVAAAEPLGMGDHARRRGAVREQPSAVLLQCEPIADRFALHGDRREPDHSIGREPVHVPEFPAAQHALGRRCRPPDEDGLARLDVDPDVIPANRPIGGRLADAVALHDRETVPAQEERRQKKLQRLKRHLPLVRLEVQCDRERVVVDRLDGPALAALEVQRKRGDRGREKAHAGVDRSVRERRVLVDGRAGVGREAAPIQLTLKPAGGRRRERARLGSRHHGRHGSESPKRGDDHSRKPSRAPKPIAMTPPTIQAAPVENCAQP